MELVHYEYIVANIHNIELPQKIYGELASNMPPINPNSYYRLLIHFNKNVYSSPTFYEYKLSKELKLPPRKRKWTPEEWKKEMIYKVLAEQLDKIKEALSPLGFDFDHCSICGSSEITSGIVEVMLAESEEKIYTKKGELEPIARGNIIGPDMERFFENLSKAVSDMKESMKRRESQQSANEPILQESNQIEASQLFKSLATAILTAEGKAIAADNVKILSNKLLSQAMISSTYPLEIRDSVKHTPIDSSSLIGCPELLIYHAFDDGHWVLKKASDLQTAKRIITTYGYNQKNTELMIVLHNLELKPFILFQDAPNGLEQLDLKEAIGKKKLMLSWK